MIIQSPVNAVALPAGYDSQDLVSINYRHFALWLNEASLERLRGHVSELCFPWSMTTRTENFRSRLNHLSNHVLSAFEIVGQHITSDTCRIIACEADKYVCSVSLVAPLPQVVFQGLQAMPCPDIFDMPEMINHDASPVTYIESRRQRYCR